MTKFVHETIIINKEVWKFMFNFQRKRFDLKPLTNEHLEKIWSRIDKAIRNNGASYITHPIDNENEIRVDKNSFNMKWNDVKQTIVDNGFEYRQDGYSVEGIHV